MKTEAVNLKRFIKKIRYSAEVFKHLLVPSGGEKVCLCCGYKGRFDAYGHPPRYGSRCIDCGSLERHRMLVLADQQEDFFAGKDVLHFAPENALSQIIGRRAKRYVTADLAPGRADCILNIERIDQPDESWDVVLCAHVLEHVDDQKALAELHRVLRPQALLVVMIPIIEGWKTTYEDPEITSAEDRQAHFGQSDHIRYYGRDFRDRLRAAGFGIHEYSASGCDTVKYGLTRGEIVFACTKKI
jgi:SAM-dependent methyltransferase